MFSSEHMHVINWIQKASYCFLSDTPAYAALCMLANIPF